VQSHRPSPRVETRLWPGGRWGFMLSSRSGHLRLRGISESGHRQGPLRVGGGPANGPPSPAGPFETSGLSLDREAATLNVEGRAACEDRAEQDHCPFR